MKITRLKPRAAQQRGSNNRKGIRWESPENKRIAPQIDKRLKHIKRIISISASQFVTKRASYGIQTGPRVLQGR